MRRLTIELEVDDDVADEDLAAALRRHLEGDTLEGSDTVGGRRYIVDELTVTRVSRRDR